MGTVGNRIRQLRKMRRMTLEQLSLAVGSDTGNLSRIERGKQSYSEGMLRSIANALGVAVADFFEERSNIEPASIGSRRIPLLDYVQAGKWTGIREDADTNPDEYLLTDLLLGPRAFAMRIRGESMLPVFQEGDCVLIDPDLAPQPGDFVVAADGNLAVFKQYRLRGVNERGQEVFELLSLNKLFPSIRSDIKPMRIVGVMVEHRSYRRR